MGFNAPVGGSIELPAAGFYGARCAGIIDQGTSYSEKWQKAQHKIMVQFALYQSVKVEIDQDSGRLTPTGPAQPVAREDGSVFYLSNFYTFSMNAKARLRLDLEAWRGGIKFNDKDAAEFDIMKVIGLPALLSVERVEKDGQQRANITSIVPPAAGMDIPKLAESDRKVFLLTDKVEGQPAWDVFESLSEKLQARIAESREYKGMQAVRNESQEAEAEAASAF